MLFKHGDKVIVSLDKKEGWAEYKLSFDQKEVTIDNFAGYWSSTQHIRLENYEKELDDCIEEAYNIIEDNHTYIWTVDNFVPDILEFLE